MADHKDFEMFFKEADADNNGSLSLCELTVTLKKYGYKGTDTEIKEYFRAADTSGDQKISKEEYLSSMQSAPALVHTAALMRRMFTIFDKSGDGEITREEFKQALGELGSKLSEESMKQIISQMDKDNSETINVEEFVSAFTRAYN